jgi:hypothetical protein
VSPTTRKRVLDANIKPAHKARAEKTTPEDAIIENSMNDVQGLSLRKAAKEINARLKDAGFKKRIDKNKVKRLRHGKLLSQLDRVGQGFVPH